MRTLLILGLQAASVAGPPMPVVPAKVSAVQACPKATDSDDVVVCGHADAERYRLRPLVPPSGVHDGPPLAQMRVGSGTLGVNAQAGSVGNTPTNRVMISFKLPF